MHCLTCEGKMKEHLDKGKNPEEVLKDEDEGIKGTSATRETESDTTRIMEESSPKESAVSEKPPEELEREYQGKIKELEDRFLRLAAEFDNYKKRTARQFEEIIRTANENILIQLLEVVDNFHRALDTAGNAADFDSLHKGTELIYQHLADILKKEGIEKIEAVGKQFDPNLHEAMMQIDSDKYPSGVVAMEMTAGYKLKGKVIRHSKVAVSRGNSGIEQDDSES